MMLRTLFVWAVACSLASGQSIVASGGRSSIIVSGRQETAEAPKPAVQEKAPIPERPAADAVTEPSVTKPPEVKPPAPAMEQVVQEEHWLVSEPWCRFCPAAKRAFLAEGHPASHILSIRQARERHGMSVTSVPFRYTTKKSVSVTAPAVRQRLPVVDTQWGRIDLETYQRNCNCPMCQGIRALQARYRAMQQPQTAVETPVPDAVAPRASQEPTPADVIDRMLDLMRLTDRDVLADFGCGDGRILIEAVRRSGCRGIGIEIDPEMAARARIAVRSAGLSDKIEIRTGDVLDFDPEPNGVTAVTAYLFPELLARIGRKVTKVRVAASPFHRIDGVPMSEHDGIWVYRSEWR